MNVGDEVLISPQVTGFEDWTLGVVTDVEDNPFVGLVITAETEKGEIFFERIDMFKEALCMQ